MLSEILDNEKLIGQIDKKGMLKTCLRTHELCYDAVELARKIELPKEYVSPRNVVFAGMGGSCIGGELLKDWLKDRVNVPMELCNDYYLPRYVNENSLVFTISYSGETEETLSVFVEAAKRKCKILAITSNGHLKTFCEKLNYPYLQIPQGFAPRAALPYMFFPLAVFMEKTELVSNIDGEIEEAINVVKKLSEENSVNVPAEKNLAKKLALELNETIPVIYGFRYYASVAHRWKTQLNENSKIPCKYEVFPELNHNEVVGWEKTGDFAKNFAAVLLREQNEPPEIKNRIEATKQIALQDLGKIFEVNAIGKTRLAKMFSLLYIGDLVSIYLAILRKVDPWPVETIAKIKQVLKERLNLISKIELEIEELLV